MKVYIINFKTTGENWHTCVCKGLVAVNKVLGSHGIINQIYGRYDSEFQEWQSPIDKTQTATVSCVTLME